MVNLRSCFTRFVLINAVAPTAYVLVINALSIATPVQFWLSLCVCGLLCVANIGQGVTCDKLRWAYITILALNLLALVGLGAVSFFTALPDLYGILTSQW